MVFYIYFCSWCCSSTLQGLSLAPYPYLARVVAGIVPVLCKCCHLHCTRTLQGLSLILYPYLARVVDGNVPVTLQGLLAGPLPIPCKNCRWPCTRYLAKVVSGIVPVPCKDCRWPHIHPTASQSFYWDPHRGTLVRTGSEFPSVLIADRINQMNADLQCRLCSI